MVTSKSTTAKKPAAKKTTAATGKASAKTATTRNTATTSNRPAATRAQTAGKKTAAPALTPTPEERYKMIQDAAYFMAEKSGFLGGAMDYWMAAEIEIDAALSGKRRK